MNLGDCWIAVGRLLAVLESIRQLLASCGQLWLALDGSGKASCNFWMVFDGFWAYVCPWARGYKIITAL